MDFSRDDAYDSLAVNGDGYARFREVVQAQVADARDPTAPSAQTDSDGAGQRTTVCGVSVVDDVDRVQALVSEGGTDDQRAWFKNWADEFTAAVETGDDEACEDLHIALIVFERLELRPSGRLLTLDEVIVSLGFDPAEFRDPTEQP